MAIKPVSAEIYTRYHRILGRFHPGPKGLFSFINIPTQSYVEIEGAHVNRLHQPGKLVARHPKLWLVKSQIQAILLSGRGEIGLTGAARRGYTHPVQHRVSIMLGHYELGGLIEFSGKFDFGSIIFEGDYIFEPLYDAQLNAILFPGVRTDCPALLFNRRMVDSMALDLRKQS